MVLNSRTKGDKSSMNTEEYICCECGSVMYKADEEVLVCPNCQHSVDIVDYYDEWAELISEEKYYVGPVDYNNPDYWQTDADFPEEFPGESYEDIYEEDE